MSTAPAMPEADQDDPPHWRRDPLPYEAKLARRRPETVTLLVIHCTELPTLAEARHYGERVLYADGTGASGHYYLDRDGSIVRYVDPLCVAHHCRGYNAHGIGVELVNRGRYPDWFHVAHQQMTEAYPAEQIDALVDLVGVLARRFPLAALAGHEDLDLSEVPAADDPAVSVRRKLDPGPMFPWPRVLAACGLPRLKPAG